MEIALQQEVDVHKVVAIAEAAGQTILNVYNQDVSNWDVEVKGDSSPLTRADKEANAVICDALMELAPHIPIVSEENRQIAYPIRKNYQYSWCVDPLDGTKEFIKRNGQFTVNIALIHGTHSVLGVVHTPRQGRTHYASVGKGAFLRDCATGKEEPIRVAEFKESDSGLTIVASASHSNAETEGFIKKYAKPTLQSMGSSLKLMLVAEGKAHIYPRLAPTSEWDTCASQIIVEEAGGEVLRYPEMVKMEYNKENPLNPFFVVYGKRLPTTDESTAGQGSEKPTTNDQRSIGDWECNVQ